MAVKIVYQDVAVGAADDASVTATQKESISDVSLIPYGGDTGAYATLEPSLWVLDGSVDIYDDEDVAYSSSNFSNSVCNFATKPTITITFDDTYTSLGIFISQLGDAYCNDLNIKWYNGSTQLASEDFTPDELDYFCENTVENYDKVVITFNAMTHPHRRLRVNRILFGIVRIFEQDELRSGTANIIQQIDHTGREVAYNTLDWTLSSKDDVDFIFQQRQRMEAYDGQTLMGVFYVDDSDRVALRQYKISCKDAVGVLGDDPFPDAYYSNKNAYALAQEICGEFAVEMDAALQSKTVTGIIYQQTRRGALQQLCFAINAIADTSGTDKVKIFALDDSDPVILDETRLRPSGSVSKTSAVTAVTVTAHSYSTSGSGQGIKIGNQTYYDTTSTQTIVNPNVGDSEKPNVVEVSDCTLVSPTNLAEVTQHLYNEVVKRQTHNVSFRLHGEMVGRYVQTITPWATDFTGFYIKGNIRLSSFALTQAEVVGDD